VTLLRTFTVTQATPVTVGLTVNDGKGGTDTTSVVVTVNPTTEPPRRTSGHRTDHGPGDGDLRAGCELQRSDVERPRRGRRADVCVDVDGQAAGRA